jgi:hypothetical protein
MQVLSLLFSSWQVHPGYWWSASSLGAAVCDFQLTQ